MRGGDKAQTDAFSYIRLEDRIPQDHRLREVKKVCDQILKQMSREFDSMYKAGGRRSIPPEKLIRALLLQVLYSVRSERQLMEQIDYNILFRWFVGLGMDEEIWVPTTFTKNRDGLLKADISHKFFSQVLQHARENNWVSDEHFTVDGTLLNAWASLKSFKPKEGSDGEDKGEKEEVSGRNSDVDYRGEKRSNKTHQSTTDPEAMLCRKGPGKEARLSFAGHLLTENRNGLVVGAKVTLATGTAEREAALDLVEQIPGNHRITVGADKGYDVADFVEVLDGMDATPHVAQKKRYSAIDSSTAADPGYAISQVKRKRVEEPFGWGKTVGTLGRIRHRGQRLVDWMFVFNMAVYNVLRVGVLARAT